MKPSESTVASIAIGAPVATLIVWFITLAGVDVPDHIEPAIGAVISAIVGFFFWGGRSADTK